MAIERIIMAEGLQSSDINIPANGSQTPEQGIKPVEPSVVVAQEAKKGGPLSRWLRRGSRSLQVLVDPEEHESIRKEIAENASLSEQERLEVAEQVVGTPLVSEQKEGILKAHTVGSGEDEVGIDGGKPRVFNYTREQIAHKARILKEAGFNKEQRRSLMELGIVGVIPPSEFDPSKFKPDDYKDPILKQIAEQVKSNGDKNRADENFFNRTLERIERLEDQGVTLDPTELGILREKLETWRINAEAQPRVAAEPEQPSRQAESDFDRVLQRIRNGEAAAQVDRKTLYAEAKKLGLFELKKTELSILYYMSRVAVTRDQKDGRGEYRDQGVLQRLRARVQQTRSGSSEARSGFWSNPAIAGLETRYGGIIDEFDLKSSELILDVVTDRKRYTSDDSSGQTYPDDTIINIWDGLVTDAAGHTLKDDNGNDVKAVDFTDFRVVIEEARRREPWVPNYRNYENPIQFVADDVDELEEMIPYIVEKVTKKLGTGQPDKLSQTLEGEKQKLDGALAIFPVESERQFRRLKSTLANNLNLMGAYFFSDKVQDDWQPYLSYMNLLATATEDTEQQDHLIDALILDRDGLTMLACQQFSENDGIFWRYGQKGANLAKDVSDTSKFSHWQINKRKDINDFLMTRKLREMQDLLDNHPAFQRLKQKFDVLDEEDRVANNGNILDVNSQPTNETRWEEYCKRAIDWEKPGKFGDVREAKRVTFQHPLARSFKPPTKNAQGQVQSEFLDMFEDDKRIGNDRSYVSTKRRKVTRIIEKAERISRAFMLDSAAALAWHFVPVKDKNNPTQEEKDNLNEINKYLKDAGENEINFDESVPQKTLFRALMRACINEDKKKLPKDRHFKIYDLMTEVMGIDLDIPTFASWYVGWHDTLRPAVILPAIRNDKRQGGLQEKGVMPAKGMDEKNTGTMWAEKERRIRLLMQMVMKAKFGYSGRYFNYPGHDTKGAGVKDVRNYLNLMYGTSKDTSWLNDLLPGALPLSQEFTGDHGLTRDPITQYVGISKGGDEVTFAKSGYTGFVENPRDFKAWVKRTGANVENSKRYTSGDKEGYALMNDGPISSAYLWRDYSSADNKYIETQKDLKLPLREPWKAIGLFKESTYRAGIDLAAKTIAPLVGVMKSTVDSTQGKNPGSARFANTLLWYAVSKWMDTSWEFREKPGYAVDANLHLARYFMHQYLLEYGQGGLIYNDKDFDTIMLGTVRVEGIKGVENVIRYVVDAQGNTKDGEGNIIYQNPDNQGNIKDGQGNVVYKLDAQGNIFDLSGKRVDRDKVVLGEINEGLIDAFPEKLRKEILKGKDEPIKDSNGNAVLDANNKVITYKDYILPFGLNSKYPETFANYYRENVKTRDDYNDALQQISKRKVTERL